MIQLNLLPDVKMEFVKTQRTKRLITLISFAVSALSIVVLAVAFLTVDVWQKKTLSDLTTDIKTYTSQLKATPDLNKILTVQNQLNTLGDLHTKKPVTSRLFTYISQVTPSQAGLNQLNVDFTGNTLTIGGKAPSLDVVSTYTDTLKATTYSLTGSSSDSKTHAFTNVVLTTFSRDATGATFTITCSFDPAIFDASNNVTLTVPATANASQSSVFGEGN